MPKSSQRSNVGPSFNGRTLGLHPGNESSTLSGSTNFVEANFVKTTMMHEIEPCTRGGDHEKLRRDALEDRIRMHWPIAGTLVLCLRCLKRLPLVAETSSTTSLVVVET